MKMNIAIDSEWVSLIVIGLEDSVNSFSQIPENEHEEDRVTREYDLKRSQEALEYFNRLDTQRIS